MGKVYHIRPAPFVPGVLASQSRMYSTQKCRDTYIVQNEHELAFKTMYIVYQHHVRDI